tara:strand:- start:51377 stop:52282 length:906 start_codon:yes stop_codon:yes gene_type:complete
LAKTKKKPKKKLNFADRVHQRLSSSVINMADSVDSFFGDQRMDDEANGSRIRIFTLTTIPEGELATTEGSFRVQLVLPKTQKRFQLVLTRQDDDQNQNDDDGNPATTPTPTNNDAQTNDQATEAGLRYLWNEANVNVSTDLGIRAEIPPRIFAQGRIRKNIEIDDNWVFRPVQKVRWLQFEGFSANTNLNFDRRINDAWLFRLVNNIQWNDQDYRIILRNGPTFLHKLSDKIGMSYNAFMVTESSPNSRVENYILSIGYRQLLYKKWFFWEVSPSMAFPRENNFHRSPAWSVKFEAIVGNI